MDASPTAASPVEKLMKIFLLFFQMQNTNFRSLTEEPPALSLLFRHLMHSNTTIYPHFHLDASLPLSKVGYHDVSCLLGPFTCQIQTFCLLMFVPSNSSSQFLVLMFNSRFPYTSHSYEVLHYFHFSILMCSELNVYLLMRIFFSYQQSSSGGEM